MDIWAEIRYTVWYSAGYPVSDIIYDSISCLISDRNPVYGRIFGWISGIWPYIQFTLLPDIWPESSIRSGIWLDIRYPALYTINFPVGYLSRNPVYNRIFGWLSDIRPYIQNSLSCRISDRSPVYGRIFGWISGIRPYIQLNVLPFIWPDIQYMVEYLPGYPVYLSRYQIHCPDTC